jgi:hypothetical protein
MLYNIAAHQRTPVDNSDPCSVVEELKQAAG